MIHHYVNLVCWRAVFRMYDPQRDRVWIDSASLRILVRWVKPEAAYRPGTTALKLFGLDSNSHGNWFFLTAKPLSNISAKHQFVLPFFADVHVPGDLASIINRLPAGTNIGIGISAPKQNYLAATLHLIRNDLEYHCLGAAISNLDRSNKQKNLNSFFSGTGFEWILFLAKSPRRTMTKILSTLHELIAVMFNASLRAEFKVFSNICATEVDTRNHQLKDLA